MKAVNHARLIALITALMLTGVGPGEAQSTASKGPAPLLRTDAIARVARMRASSVVSLHTVGREPIAQDWPIEEGLGSGVVIDAGGLILTNAHVVADASVIHVLTPDGDNVKATVIGTDPATDLALLRASDARGLQPAPLGDSDRLQVGDWVVAIGNPLGLHHTVTAGIVSAKSRALDDSGVEFLQTDAAVSSGSSGGPLLDLSGSVVGINVGLISVRGKNVGLNLAIPISLVKEVLPHLLTGSVVHGWIGVMTAPLTPRGATTRGLSQGLIVTGIREESPAHRARLQPGDIVIGFTDDPSLKLRDFYPHIRSRSPGTELRLDVWRNGQRLVIQVEVGRHPRSDDGA